MTDAVTSRKSFVVRVSTIGGFGGEKVGEAGTLFTDDIETAIRFAQDVERDEFVPKVVDINAVVSSSRDLFRKPEFKGFCRPPKVFDQKQSFQGVFFARVGLADVSWHMSKLTTGPDGPAIAANKMFGWHLQVSALDDDAAERETARVLSGTPYDQETLAVVAFNRSETNLAKVHLHAKSVQRGEQRLLSPARPASPNIPGGPIVGFRCWRMRVHSSLTGRVAVVGDQEVPEVRIDGVELVSLHTDAVWTGAQVMFQCNLKPAHETPQASHKCGLYAYHRKGEATHEKVPSRWPASEYPVVMGVVSGHGDVLIHGPAWRAEEAHVLGIADVGDCPEARRFLTASWDIPLVKDQDLETFAGKRGRTIRKEDIHGPEDEL